MDWSLKPTWDFTEFEQETIPKAVDGSSSRTKGNFSVDLKLGQVNNSAEDSLNKCKEPGASKMESPSPSGSSKRARAANNGSQTASCLVDGCDSDLSNCRDYHRRHKVCELHSKTPQVLICGQKQRFCQQCSRFNFVALHTKFTWVLNWKCIVIWWFWLYLYNTSHHICFCFCFCFACIYIYIYFVDY